MRYNEDILFIQLFYVDMTCRIASIGIVFFFSDVISRFFYLFDILRARLLSKIFLTRAEI